MEKNGKRLIDPRYEIASFKGLVSSVLFQEILKRRIDLEDMVAGSEIMLRIAKKQQRAFEDAAIRHLTEIEPDIKGSPERIKRLFLRFSQEAWSEAVRLINQNEGKLTQESLKAVSGTLSNHYEYRKGLTYVVGSPVPVVSPHSIEREMQKVLCAVGSTKQDSPAARRDRLSTMEKAFLYHFHIVRIHPFEDGNGRTARIVQNATLYDTGFPPAIILTDEREVYISLLRSALIGFAERKDAYENKLTKEKESVKSEANGELYLCASPQEKLFFEYLASKINIELSRIISAVSKAGR